jgi:hypothetical protein
MPPDSGIEFIIELQPGTPPISKRPYRMPINDSGAKEANSGATIKGIHPP